MGGMDAGGGEKKHKGKGQKKPVKKRVGVRVDMTPMVDVAFLLLTFFMLTTVFAKPQTMELKLPEDDKSNVEVAESNLLTLNVMPSRTIWWNMGFEDPKPASFQEIHNLLQERSKANPRLVTLVKVDRGATYNEMVDVMDELNLANITRFSLAPMSDRDKAKLARLGAS